MISLHEGEKILSVNRKVWFAFAPIYGSAIGLMTMPLIVLPSIGVLLPISINQPFLGVMLLVAIFWMWAAWIWLFLSLLNYYLDIFILTNERIIHIEQRSLFNRVVSEIRLSRVQDITITIRGFLSTTLNYGNIRIQSAAEIPEFVFTEVRYPEKLKELIMQEHRHAVAQEHLLSRPVNPATK